MVVQDDQITYNNPSGLAGLYIIGFNHDNILIVDEITGKSANEVKAYVEEKMKAGFNVILEIEIQGARNIKKIYPDAVLIFIMPPGADELEDRLRGRGTETDDVIRKRMDRAALESDGIEDYDYIAVNDEIDKCVSDVHTIIEAAKMRPQMNEEFINKVREGLKKKASR